MQNKWNKKEKKTTDRSPVIRDFIITWIQSEYTVVCFQNIFLVTDG